MLFWTKNVDRYHFLRKCVFLEIWAFKVARNTINIHSLTCYCPNRLTQSRIKSWRYYRRRWQHEFPPPYLLRAPVTKKWLFNLLCSKIISLYGSYKVYKIIFSTLMYDKTCIIIHFITLNNAYIIIYFSNAQGGLIPPCLGWIKGLDTRQGIFTGHLHCNQNGV